MQKLAIAALASLVGLMSFMVGFKVHFPGDAVLERTRWQVQDASGGTWALEALDASWWMPAGLTLEDAVLYSVDVPRKKRRRKKRKQAEDAAELGADGLSVPVKATPVLRADSAAARIALLPLLTGRTAVDFDLELYGGEATGTAGDEAEFTTLQTSIEGIDLARMPSSGDDWSVDAVGALSAEIDLRLAKDTGRDGPGHEGSVKLNIDGFAIQAASAMGIDLMPATFSQAVLELEMDGTKAEVREGRFIGDILELTVDGHINMNSQDPDRWRLRLELQLELEDQLDTMASMLPMLKQAKDDAGTYHLLCSGTFSRPVCREDRSKVRGASPLGRPPSPGTIGRDQKRNRGVRPEPPGRADEDADERRRKRRERIAERREKLRREREEREERIEDRDSLDEELDDEPEFDDIPEPVRPFPREPGVRPEFIPEDEGDLPRDFDGGPPDINENLEDMGYME